jgi:Asp/Glu/hydantoin racemase
VSPLPVIGLADACFRKAPSPFAVLTLGPDWGPILQAQAEASRPSACVGVWALAATGLDFVRDPASLVARMDIACDEAAAAGARSIILGGVVLAGKGDLLRSKVPLIDCIEAAAEAAVACLCGSAMTSHQQPADRTVTTPTPSH